VCPFPCPPVRIPWNGAAPASVRAWGSVRHSAVRAFRDVASRLCYEAKPGQILIIPRVLTKVENAVSVEPVGEFALKGIRRPLAAYNVLGAVS
jgi:adenylate cyclase